MLPVIGTFMIINTSTVNFSIAGLNVFVEIPYFVPLVPRSCSDFFFWEHIKGLVYVSTAVKRLKELRKLIQSAVITIDRIMLQNEVNYSLDVRYVTHDAHIEHFLSVQKTCCVCDYFHL